MMDRDRAKDDPVLKHIDDADTGADTYAAIMATQKPDPRGPGYMKLYLLALMVFLCSTMNGVCSWMGFKFTLLTIFQRV